MHLKQILKWIAWCRFVADIVAEFVAQQSHPQLFAWSAICVSSWAQH
jgi:hypothetical protein